jgi:(R,R)-butanediol dehydrogenase / meso-butanediol dehydrogenase / diacetyl reductase
MRAAVFHEVGKPLTVENVDDPAPASDEVVLKISRAGICGSDLHQAVRPGALKPGSILGHEFAGEIAAIGSGVTGGWRAGERVTALPIYPCRHCEACDAGLPSMCSSIVFSGYSLDHRGAYAEYIAVRGDLLQRIPDGVSEDEAGMVEPVTVGYHAVHRAENVRGAAVLVLGGGPIGAAAVLGARMGGAAHVVVSEPASVRRERCGMLGASGVIDPATEDVASRFHALAGRNPDIVIECTGVPAVVGQAIELCGLRGQVIIAGTIRPKQDIPGLAMFMREVTLRYSNAYTTQDFADVIDLIARREIDVLPMKTALIGLDQVPEVFDSLHTDPRQCKVLIEPGRVSAT